MDRLQFRISSYAFNTVCICGFETVSEFPHHCYTCHSAQIWTWGAVFKSKATFDSLALVCDILQVPIFKSSPTAILIHSSVIQVPIFKSSPIDFDYLLCHTGSDFQILTNF
jgi:hypothetical protein